MFFRIISYLTFLLKSSNQHGVHSPFVYHFITKGLYKKGMKVTVFNEYPELIKLSNKEQKMLSKIVNYFNIDKIQFNQTALSTNLNKDCNHLLYSNIEYFNVLDLSVLNSNQFVVLHRIHQHKNSQLKWQEIIKNKEATVTIDLFYYGLIFFRKEQAKEHFNIRA
tara:strand:+ start:1007 stop:1501 length:495 start_codon:yes stop_codon:yes gene_type:complete